MSEPKRPLKVFLCHAHADRDPVRGLYTRLTKDGVDAWLDKEKLLPGQDWELEIRKAVREADVVVVCLSKQFNQAGFRQKEVRLALDTAMEKPEGEIFIIPARLEECDNLESLRRWHWVDLFEEDGYEMLMRALRARADRIGVTLQIRSSWLSNIKSSDIHSYTIDQPVAKQEKLQSKSMLPKQKMGFKKLVARIGLLILSIIVILTLMSPFLQLFLPNNIQTPTVMYLPTNTRIIGSPPPTVSFSSCQAVVSGIASVFNIPSDAGLIRANLDHNSVVEIIAQLDDSEWYPVKWDENNYGWILRDNLVLNEECAVVVDTFPHLLSFVFSESFVNDMQNLIIDDTFSSNAYLWFDETDTPVDSKMGGGGEYQLVLDKLEYKVTSYPLGNVADPSFAISLNRQDFSANSYFGISFLDTVGGNFEVRILGDCTIQVFESMSLLVASINSVSNCSKNGNEYIEFMVNNEQLTVRINGQNSDVFVLSNDYSNGTFSLMAHDLKAALNFIVVTTTY